MKGGVFNVTYKQLVIDLLCKRVSPLIITGLIINEAQKCHKHHSPENFLLKIIRGDNSDAFVKCLSTKPETIKRAGQAKLEIWLRELTVSRLILIPRINSSIQVTLSGESKGAIKVCEQVVGLEGALREIH
jgi:hypothetical protein